jgi:hypothetical protein
MVKEKQGWVVFGVGFILALLLGWFFFGSYFAVPPLYGKLRQPVAFSHKVHVEDVGMGCETCHYLQKDGLWSGVPKLAQCVQCHQEPMGESEEERKFIEVFVKKDKEIPWLTYSKQPKNVFFSHAAHLKIARFKCQQCHGELGYNDRPPVYVYSKLSRYPQHYVIVMEECMKCHKKYDSPNYCFTCHK